MSYCRCGKDSDVYVYEDIHGGFTCHVANYRYVPVGHSPPNTGIPQEPIGLPRDGDTFNVVTATDMIATLRNLRALGYKVPEEALDKLRRTG